MGGRGHKFDPWSGSSNCAARPKGGKKQKQQNRYYNDNADNGDGGDGNHGVRKLRGIQLNYLILC